MFENSTIKKNKIKKLDHRVIDNGAILSVIWDLVIADESHRIKTPSSRAAWFCHQITKKRKAKRRLLLTGTPMPHSPLDIYSQFRFLDPNVYATSFHRFKMRYADIINMGDFKKIVGYKDLDSGDHRWG